MKRIQFQIISIAALGIISFSEGAWAKKAGSSSIQYHLKKKSPTTKKSAPEIYPALESDEGAPLLMEAQKQRPPASVNLTQRAESSSSTLENQKDYDVVPKQLSTPLIRRLQLVQILIQKYNRAYDYRTRTTSELEKILMDLETKHRQPAMIPAQISLAPEVESSGGDAAPGNDPLFSGNVEAESLLETLPDLPPPNPA